jgi:acyl-CoA synthetase (AMP-forming)/AMP-acid ligase II
MARASAERFGEADAVVDGDIRMSFAAIADQMHSFAASLIASGIEPGDRVALWAPNSAAWITAALGIQAARAWLVPLNTRFTGSEAAYILSKTGARLLVVAEGFLGNDYVGMLHGTARNLPALREVVSLPLPGAATAPGWEVFVARGAAVPTAAVEASIDAGEATDVSDVIFTSGTTGRPKGVMLRHGASLFGYQIFADRFALGAGDRYVVPTPFFHCFGYKAGWMISLMSGATAFPLAVFDANAVLELIDRNAVTHMPGPPTMFTALLDNPRRSEFDLSSLRHAMIGAASIPPDVVRRVRTELHVETVLSAYGLTENHALATLTEPADPPEVVASTVGRPLPEVEVRIVDHVGTDQPQGQSGEVLLRSSLRMSGYFDDEEATAEAFDDGWLRTGDVGLIDDGGRLRITDRKKDMFIVGGFNVAPAEVEKTLLGMEGVAQVAVVGMDDDYFGEVGAAFIVAHEGVHLRPDDVVSFARKHLANYKVPRRVEMVNALPLTATGKVLKGALRQRFQSKST